MFQFGVDLSRDLFYSVTISRDSQFKMADKEKMKNEKKPLNRQNSSWYNMSFLDYGYSMNTSSIRERERTAHFSPDVVPKGLNLS
jgi:hypothetical protein